ncbi:MAG: hypothetical protein LBG86_00915 [Puniceicoccales bacterium]|nr:hypothetical protein [Puniceicoccales bacterium]
MKKSRPFRQKDAFTLLEMLLALSIAMVIATCLGKFFQCTLQNIMFMQRRSNYHFQCARVLQLMEEDLWQGEMSSLTTIAPSTYAWRRKGNLFEEEEDGVSCIYALDSSGNIHRLILRDDEPFYPSLLDVHSIIGTGFSSLQLVPIDQNEDGSNCLEVILDDQRKENTYRAKFRDNCKAI